MKGFSVLWLQGFPEIIENCITFGFIKQNHINDIDLKAKDLIIYKKLIIKTSLHDIIRWWSIIS